MSRKTIFILFLFLPVLLVGKNIKINDALKELDACIEKRASFEAEKKQRIEDLENRFTKGNLSLDIQFQLCSELYTEYRSYKYDSAYSIAGRMLRYAEGLQDPNLIAESKVALAFSCMSAGLFKEATEISSSIDTTQLQLSNKANLFSFLSMLNMNMADFSPDPYYIKYRNYSLTYCNKYITLSKNVTSGLIIVKIRRYQLESNYEKARTEAEYYLSTKNPGSHDYAILASMLGYFYQTKGDTTKAIIYFSKAAIVDLEMATKETSAIRQIAELLYSKGDIQHAYSYAMLALADANFYNARQRKIEVGRILPIIEDGRFEIIKQQKDRLLTYAGLISVLLILFLVATFIIIRQNKKLSTARQKILQQNNDLMESNEELTLVQKKISKQNIDLIHINEKLKEAHHIKDEYIGYFFSNNSAFIEKLEEFRKMVARKIRNRQFDELTELAATSDMRKDREELFALFDQIFMKIFPDFVNRYNKLFNEEDHVTIKSDGILTPEIRIFALIRLGITESERIAHFLDFSLSTVKNYKTKVKNRSIVQNELFESKIMEIESVKTEIQERNDE